MDIGRKIYELRKKNNITQEQLASAVGVSTPAVSKWETGVSMPDIMLLAPIARKLNTSIDALLSFKEHLNDAEIEQIAKELKDTARREGLNAALQKSRNYLKEYPNCDELKLQAAMLPAMMAHTAEEEYLSDDKYQELMEESNRLLEDLLHSDTEFLRMAAILNLVSRYMQQQRFNEAEALLKKAPNQDYGIRQIYPSLYLMKNEEEKAMESSQANMLQDVQNILADIQIQHTVYLKNRKYEKALKCAKDYFTLVKLVGPSALCGSELLINTYLAMKDRENAETYFLNYIDEIREINGIYDDSFYYSHIGDKVVVASQDVENDVRASLYRSLIFNEKYRSLRESEVVRKKLEDLEQLIQPNNRATSI